MMRFQHKTLWRWKRWSFLGETVASKHWRSKNVGPTEVFTTQWWCGTNVEQYIVFTATLEHAAISVTLETTHLPLAFLPHHRPPAGFQLNHLNAPTFSNCSSPPSWKFQSVDNWTAYPHSAASIIRTRNGHLRVQRREMITLLKSYALPGSSPA